MRLSELSYRDYIAIDVVGHLAGQMPDEDAARRAYGVADAMLKQAGKRNHELEELREKAATAERTLEILRPVWAQGFTTDSVAAQSAGTALAQLWSMLDVDNQTAAVSRLETLIAMENEQ
jgi:hypothetical protein